MPNSPLTRTEIMGLATAAFGPVNRRLCNGRELRFGRKGSVSVDLERGLFFDHERGAGGRLGPVSNSSRSIAPPLNSSRSMRPEQIERIWASANPGDGTVLEAYLAVRGVALPPAGADVVRFHPDLLHGPSGTSWPAMLAAITDAETGALIGLHRTWLARGGDGKAPVTPDRMILGHKKGGVIRLVADQDVENRLALAEGIETALTAVGQGWSCWAAVDAGNLKVLPVWPATDLIVFADNDNSGTGLAAAKHLARRWKEAGGYADISMPRREGTDWNDLLQ